MLEGKLPEGATGKDVIITLCGLYNHDEVLNAAVEFSGPGVASLSMDARFSIANMTTEWGPLVGWFPVDEVTINYLRGVHAATRRSRASSASPKRTCESWAQESAAPDADAVYAARIMLDLGAVTPHVSGPDTVQVMPSLAEIEKKKSRNPEGLSGFVRELAPGRSGGRGESVAREEGRAGREILSRRGQQVGAGRSGAARHLADAAGRRRASACRRVAGLHRSRRRDLLEPGEVGISATNRNFKGRMGSRDAQCYLASPEVVAASAVAGYICGPRRFADATPERSYEEFTANAAAGEKVEILPGFPERVKGRLVFCRRTTSIPTGSTARTTPIATT